MSRTRRTKMTVRVDEEKLDYAKRYAAQHDLTLTALIDRLLTQLRRSDVAEIHPKVRRISGLVPADVDGSAEYHAAIRDKHS